MSALGDNNRGGWNLHWGYTGQEAGPIDNEGGNWSPFGRSPVGKKLLYQRPKIADQRAKRRANPVILHGANIEALSIRTDRGIEVREVRRARRDRQRDASDDFLTDISEMMTLPPPYVPDLTRFEDVARLAANGAEPGNDEELLAWHKVEQACKPKKKKNKRKNKSRGSKSQEESKQAIKETVLRVAQQRYAEGESLVAMQILYNTGKLDMASMDPEALLRMLKVQHDQGTHEGVVRIRNFATKVFAKQATEALFAQINNPEAQADAQKQDLLFYYYNQYKSRGGDELEEVSKFIEVSRAKQCTSYVAALSLLRNPECKLNARWTIRENIDLNTIPDEHIVGFLEVLYTAEFVSELVDKKKQPNSMEEAIGWYLGYSSLSSVKRRKRFENWMDPVQKYCFDIPELIDSRASLTKLRQTMQEYAKVLRFSNAELVGEVMKSAAQEHINAVHNAALAGEEPKVKDKDLLQFIALAALRRPEIFSPELCKTLFYTAFRLEDTPWSNEFLRRFKNTLKKCKSHEEIYNLLKTRGINASHDLDLLKTEVQSRSNDLDINIRSASTEDLYAYASLTLELDIELKNNNADAWNTLGSALSDAAHTQTDQKDAFFERAISCFEIAYEMRPDNIAYARDYAKYVDHETSLAIYYDNFCRAENYYSITEIEANAFLKAFKPEKPRLTVACAELIQDHYPNIKKARAAFSLVWSKTAIDDEEGTYDKEKVKFLNALVSTLDDQSIRLNEHEKKTLGNAAFFVFWNLVQTNSIEASAYDHTYEIMTKGQTFFPDDLENEIGKISDRKHLNLLYEILDQALWTEKRNITEGLAPGMSNLVLMQYARDIVQGKACMNCVDAYRLRIAISIMMMANLVTDNADEPMMRNIKIESAKATKDLLKRSTTELANLMRSEYGNVYDVGNFLKNITQQQSAGYMEIMREVQQLARDTPKGSETPFINQEACFRYGRNNNDVGALLQAIFWDNDTSDGDIISRAAAILGMIFVRQTKEDLDAIPAEANKIFFKDCPMERASETAYRQYISDAFTKFGIHLVLLSACNDLWYGRQALWRILTYKNNDDYLPEAIKNLSPTLRKRVIFAINAKSDKIEDCNPLSALETAKHIMSSLSDKSASEELFEAESEEIHHYDFEYRDRAFPFEYRILATDQRLASKAAECLIHAGKNIADEIVMGGNTDDYRLECAYDILKGIKSASKLTLHPKVLSKNEDLRNFWDLLFSADPKQAIQLHKIEVQLENTLQISNHLFRNAGERSAPLEGTTEGAGVSEGDSGSSGNSMRNEGRSEFFGNHAFL